MKKLFRILMCGAMLLTVASSAFIVSKAILDKPDDVVEANAATDGTFGMYYAGGSSATLRQYTLAGTLPTDISTNVMDTVAYTSGLSSYSPDGGTRADTRTYTTVSFTEARVMVIPVRLAVNVNAYSKKKLKSFSGSISVSRTTSSKPAAKIELLHSLTSGFTVKSAINTSSSNVTASTYIQSGSTVGSTSFSFNNGGNGIEFLNKGSSAGPIIYDNFYLIFSMPTRDSSCQYTITMSIISHDIDDLGNYVAYDSSDVYYSQSEFEAALTSQGTATNTFTLTKDFTLESQLTFSNVTRTINFANHRIDTAVDNAFVIGSGSSVTFNGNNGSSIFNSGGIYSQTSGNSLILMQTGILTINSGMYGVLNILQGTGLGYVIKNLSPSGTLNINGGKFLGTYDVYDTGGLVYYIGGGTFQAETQCIFNSSTTSGLMCIFGEPTFDKPLSIAKYINLNNNNAYTPLYYTGSGTIELTIANNLKSANQTIASGAQSEAILSNIVITNIENTGYAREIVAGSGTYGLRLANYSCTPILHLSNCSVVGDVPVMTFAASSGASFSFEIEAEMGYYFGSTSAGYASEANSVTFTYVASDRYLNNLYRNCTIYVRASDVKRQIEFTITPAKSTHLTRIETFISEKMHMTDYTTSKGWCKDDEHHYFSTAMEVYNSDNTDTFGQYARKIFNESTNADIVAAQDRLSKWALANGYYIDDSSNSYKLVAVSNEAAFANVTNSDSLPLIVIVTSLAAITAIGFVVVYRRKHK